MRLDSLDYPLVAETPSPEYMGELPRRWEELLGSYLAARHGRRIF